MEFIVPVDVTEVDFADIVNIKENEVEVYDEVRHKECYPERGTKLNQPAIITLNNIKPR